MDQLRVFVSKSLKTWSKNSETTVSKKILKLRVKPYKNWEKRLKTQLIMPSNADAPKTYHELLRQINGMSVYCQNLFYIVMNNGNAMVIVAVVLSCLDIDDPNAANEVVPYFVEIGDNAANHKIKNFGKVVSKSVWKHVQKTSFTVAKNIEYHRFAFNKKYV